MPCIRIKNGFLCGPRVVQYKGYIFALPRTGPPLRLRKSDLMPWERPPGAKFYAAVKEWMEECDDHHGNCAS
jgi:hypothetical protein